MAKIWPGTQTAGTQEGRSVLEQIIKYKNNIQKPLICPNEIFELMNECFNIESEKRPNFELIRNKLFFLLERETENYGYISLK
uniref:Serine-threonine/tyrosine-protein kinase catalytic domain-containing protein n=1 Tax=Meloidogyne incognita TaxID=6306 RepID=A0A914KY92_MELIC